jgi:hypothetical protein
MGLSRKMQMRYLKAVGKNSKGWPENKALQGLDQETSSKVLAYLASLDLLDYQNDQRCYGLNRHGRMWIKRAMSAPDDAYLSQHRCLHTSYEGPVRLCENLAESPLKMLAHKRGQKEPFLDQAQVRAAEQLQHDIMVSGLVAKTTMSWERLQTGRIKEMANTPHSDQSPHRLDCRHRLHRAFETLGPDLSNIALDVCVFLKKLGQIEKERNLPQRSAKVLLKIALERLAVFYGFMSRPQSVLEQVQRHLS